MICRVILSEPIHWGKNAFRQTAHDGDAFIVGFGTIIGVRWEGLESKKFQRVCQITHLDRIVTEACLRLRQSPCVLALICLFQRTLAERTNVAVWS